MTELQQPEYFLITKEEIGRIQGVVIEDSTHEYKTGMIETILSRPYIQVSEICDDCSFNDVCFRQAGESCKTALARFSKLAAYDEVMERVDKVCVTYGSRAMLIDLTKAICELKLELLFKHGDEQE
jgi:hypothetical protein